MHTINPNKRANKLVRFPKKIELALSSTAYRDKELPNRKKKPSYQNIISKQKINSQEGLMDDSGFILEQKMPNPKKPYDSKKYRILPFHHNNTNPIPRSVLLEDSRQKVNITNRKYKLIKKNHDGNKQSKKIPKQNIKKKNQNKDHDQELQTNLSPTIRREKKNIRTSQILTFSGETIEFVSLKNTEKKISDPKYNTYKMKQPKLANFNNNFVVSSNTNKNSNSNRNKNKNKNKNKAKLKIINYNFATKKNLKVKRLQRKSPNNLNGNNKKMIRDPKIIINKKDPNEQDIDKSSKVFRPSKINELPIATNIYKTKNMRVIPNFKQKDIFQSRKKQNFTSTKMVSLKKLEKVNINNTNNHKNINKNGNNDGNGNGNGNGKGNEVENGNRKLNRNGNGKDNVNRNRNKNRNGNGKRNEGKKQIEFSKNLKKNVRNIPTKKEIENYFFRRKWKLEDLKFVKQLGQGQFGKVYLVKDKKTNIRLAVKVLKTNTLKTSGSKKQLAREINVQSSLKHPNILKMFGYCFNKDHVFLILEYAQGGELYKVLCKCGKFSEKRAANYIANLSSAVHYFHSKNVIHRDIKPENILITKDGTLKIADFGFSVFTNPKNFRRYTFCGTLDYLPPEMVEGTSYDHSVDKWSMGVLLFEFLVGKPPFETKGRLQTYNRITNVNFSFPNHVSELAQDLIKKMLTKCPSKRIPFQDLLQHPWIQLYVNKKALLQLQPHSNIKY
ncbi:aurora a [Anaeramoeba flamelloides]|uniref:Aurora kinase n=1 Tax=Anaeramoeba flamelloides TaxID=1746091 RepID=A0ABQ8YGK7_9EUKA|nr:aurora a [Anaeramoeba flamelloides]